MTFRETIQGDTSGGLNTRGNERNLAPNESPKALNIDIIPEGGIIKSNGSVQVNKITFPDAINGLHEYRPAAGASQILFQTSNDLYRLFTDGDTTKLSDGEFANRKISFTNFNNVVIMTNGLDPVRVWTGLVVEDLGGFPGDFSTNGSPKFSLVWKNRLWMWGDPTKPYRIYVSEPGNHEGWASSGGAFAFDVDIGNGDFITQIFPLGDRLIVHKERSIHVITGSNKPGDGVLDEVTLGTLFQGFGADAPFTVVNIVNDQVFVADRAIRSLKNTIDFGGIDAKTLSYPIEPLVQNLNFNRLNEAFALFYPKNDEVWFFLPTGSSGQNDQVLVYNIEVGAWTERNGFTAKSGIIFEGKPLLGTYDGRIVRHDFGGNYLGKPIEGIYQTHWNTFGAPQTTKRIRSIDVTAKRLGLGIVEVNMGWDYQNLCTEYQLCLDPPDGTALWGVALWGVDKWSPATTVETRQISGVGFGKVFQTQFKNRYADQPFHIMGWDYLVQPRNHRGGPYTEPFDPIEYLGPQILRITEDDQVRSDEDDEDRIIE